MFSLVDFLPKYLFVRTHRYSTLYLYSKRFQTCAMISQIIALVAPINSGPAYVLLQPGSKLNHIGRSNSEVVTSSIYTVRLMRPSGPTSHTSLLPSSLMRLRIATRIANENSNTKQVANQHQIVLGLASISRYAWQHLNGMGLSHIKPICVATPTIFGGIGLGKHYPIRVATPTIFGGIGIGKH